MAPKFLAMFLLMLINLALFCFNPTNAATCPNLNSCLNFQSGSSGCCSLLKELNQSDATFCLCISLKNTGQSGSIPLIGGLGPTLLNNVPLIGNLIPGLISGLLPVFGNIPAVGPILGGGAAGSQGVSQQFANIVNVCGLISTITCA